MGNERILLKDTARNELKNRYKQMRNYGLIDLKIYLGDVSSVTVEQICAEVNKIFDMVDRGDITERKW